MPDTTTTTALNAPTPTFTVCLPAGTDLTFLPALAHARLATAGYSVLGPVRHFPVTDRRARRRLKVDRGFTSLGPVGLLDLAMMRRCAAVAAAQTWQHWNYVVSGTPIARPFWFFVDRHRADPSRYPLAQAQHDYATQPRILAMRTFNALPRLGGALPTGELEALQQGLNTYAALGELAVVVADGLVTVDGRVLTPATTRLHDQLAYLHQANHYLATLPADQPIAAFAVTTAPTA